LKTIYSERTIESILNKLNINSSYPSHLSKQDFCQGFNIEKRNNGRTINITYKHLDPDFANQVMDVWQEYIFDSSSFNYDISAFSYTFAYSEHINAEGIKGLSLILKDKPFINYELVELPSFNCN